MKLFLHLLVLLRPSGAVRSYTTMWGPCHSLSGQLPTYLRGGPGSIPGQAVWNLW